MSLLAHRFKGTRSIAPRCWEPVQKNKNPGPALPDGSNVRTRRLLVHRLAHRVPILTGQRLIFVMRARNTDGRTGAVFATDATQPGRAPGIEVRCAR